MVHAVAYPVLPEAQPEFSGKQEHVHRVIVELVSPDNFEPSEPLTTNEKVVRAVAYSLIAIGIIFLLASTGFFGAGAIAGSGTAMIFGKTFFPLGIVSLIGGTHLLSPPRAGRKIESAIRLGPLTVSL